jgi:hypothetical protein
MIMSEITSDQRLSLDYAYSEGQRSIDSNSISDTSVAIMSNMSNETAVGNNSSVMQISDKDLSTKIDNSQQINDLVVLERFKTDILQSIKSLCIGPVITQLVIEENRYKNIFLTEMCTMTISLQGREILSRRIT